MFIFVLCVRKEVVTRWCTVMERKQVVKVAALFRVAALFSPILVETF